jgi:hypothetical protein
MSCVLLFAMAMACGERDPSAETESAFDVQSSEYADDSLAADSSEAAPVPGILPAGALGQRLRVEHWVVSDASIEGISESGETLAKFVLDVDSGVLESVLPDAGFKMLDGSESALSEASRAYLDAVISDLESVANQQPEAQGQSSEGDAASELGTAQLALTVACFTTVSGCQAAGVLGLIDGRWRSFTCENRALFGCRAPFPIALVIP